MERMTKKRNGKNVIPLLNAVCGINMPYWRIDEADSLHRYLAGDAADKLAAYEDTGFDPEEIAEIRTFGPVCIGCDGRDEDGRRTDKCDWERGDYIRCVEQSKKLVDLKKAEEHGLLIRLPCEIGDRIYVPSRRFLVSEFRVTGFRFCQELFVEWKLELGIIGNYRIDGIRASEIGKTVFLTRAEAEAVLNRGDGE